MPCLALVTENLDKWVWSKAYPRLLVMSFEKSLKSGIDFQVGFWEEIFFFCNNCYIMRASVTSCHIVAVFFYLLVWSEPIAPLRRWKKEVFPTPAGIWFLPTAVLLYTTMKSGNRPSQINHRGLTFPANCAHIINGRVQDERRGGGFTAKKRNIKLAAEQLEWCPCLCALMPSPISLMSLRSHLLHFRKVSALT